MQLISTQLRNRAFLTMFYKIQTSIIVEGWPNLNSSFLLIAHVLYNQQPSALSINL